MEAGLYRKYLRKAIEARKKENRRRGLYRLDHDEAENEMRKLELQGSRYGIIAAMFMQDGPFLFLRLYLLIKYDFFRDSTFLFYIGKNIVSLLLMISRLYVIHFHAKDEEVVVEKAQGFRTLSFVMLGAQRFKSQKQRNPSLRNKRFSLKKLTRWNGQTVYISSTDLRDWS